VLTTRWTGNIALFVFFCGLFAACVKFGILQPAPAEGRYPYAGDIVQHPDQYEGESVVVNGEVVATQPLQVEAGYSVVRDSQVERGTVMFTVTNARVAASIGGVIQVFGI
jgi:hypothetical protein